MPLGFERLNERTQRPNALINFIKPLPGPDQATSQDFLNRIAAQCYPVMKANCISVMALEEYAPNPEFLGRNFNAGEVIQLVLKGKSGRWLGFKFVQMVMMHELAHCKQMNHSKFFWQVRNGYAKEMEGLWARKYAGEGMWGRGQDLTSGAFVMGRMPEQGDVPEHLCGGTYRRRGRKRKRGSAADGGDGKVKLTYAERQQKRITRKFGVHGEGSALGDDELIRGALESASGKRHAGKPRVANSKRGRELRAQAALARFDAIKKEPAAKDESKVKEETAESDSETESVWEGDDDGVTIKQEDGETDLVRVCGDEGEDEGGAQDEMDELRMMSQRASEDPDNPNSKDDQPESVKKGRMSQKSSHSNPQPVKPMQPPDAQWELGTKASNRAVTNSDSSTDAPARASPENPSEPQPTQIDSEAAASNEQPAQPAQPALKNCPICSMENEPGTPTCIACSHVLAPNLVRDHWRCSSDTCKDSQYINAGDAGRCGICGAQKPKPSVGINSRGNDGGMRPVGVMGSDVLRWD